MDKVSRFAYPPFVGVSGEVVDTDIGDGIAGGAQEGEDGEQGQQLGHATHQDDPGPVGGHS